MLSACTVPIWSTTIAFHLKIFVALVIYILTEFTWCAGGSSSIRVTALLYQQSFDSTRRESDTLHSDEWIHRWGIRFQSRVSVVGRSSIGRAILDASQQLEQPLLEQPSLVVLIVLDGSRCDDPRAVAVCVAK